jgi:hypothetical protein
VLLALKFSGNLDITGVATVGLALLTVVLASVAWRQAGLVRQQVEDARQPVVVPGGRNADAAPSTMAGQLVVPVVNVGMGPALEVEGEVWVAGQAERYPARRPIPGLPVGATGTLGFQAPYSADSEFRLTLMCRDAAHAPHRTSAAWNPQRGFVEVLTATKTTASKR